MKKTNFQFLEPALQRVHLQLITIEFLFNRGNNLLKTFTERSDRETFDTRADECIFIQSILFRVPLHLQQKKKKADQHKKKKTNKEKKRRKKKEERKKERKKTTNKQTKKKERREREREK
jgi:hypothetical protein